MGRVLILAILTSAVFSGLTPAARAGTTTECSDLLSGKSTPETLAVIAYLGGLLERQVIGDRELTRFIEGLRAGRLVNPIFAEEAAASSALYIHREGIEAYLRDRTLDLEQLKVWVGRALKDRALVRVKRDETRVETADIHQKMEFQPVPAGKFQMGQLGDVRGVVDVELSHPFEVMSTPLTQKHWVELMGENPSKFRGGENAIVVVVNGKQEGMQPDNPVENITWWSAIICANKLSQEHGLKPAYDVSGVRWQPGTRAEDGTLEADGGAVKINAPDGDIYQTEGYRLPTEAEQEYVLRAAGTANGEYHFGDLESELKDHAWYCENSNLKTHPVAQLKPLYIGGKAFFDLLGNVWEWGYDGKSGILQGGKNPVCPPSGARCVVRGGSWNHNADDLSSGTPRFSAPGQHTATTGARFVRTLR